MPLFSYLLKYSYDIALVYCQGHITAIVHTMYNTIARRWHRRDDRTTARECERFEAS